MKISIKSVVASLLFVSAGFMSQAASAGNTVNDVSITFPQGYAEIGNTFNGKNNTFTDFYRFTIGSSELDAGFYANQGKVVGLDITKFDLVLSGGALEVARPEAQRQQHAEIDHRAGDDREQGADAQHRMGAHARPSRTAPGRTRPPRPSRRTAATSLRKKGQPARLRHVDPRGAGRCTGRPALMQAPRPIDSARPATPMPSSGTKTRFISWVATSTPTAMRTGVRMSWRA
jgi:hypothetical protein